MRLCLIATVLIIGCVEVAEKRAIREAQIGQKNSQGISVQIEDGLASIRELDNCKLVLWAQAPRLVIRVRADQELNCNLELLNAMPGARLSGIQSNSIEQIRPTHKVWTLTLPRGETVLKIAPDDADDVEAWRFVVFADVQDRIDGIQDIFKKMIEDDTIRFGLISGDLTEQGSTQELSRFQKEMETLPFPLFATLGNHELGADSHSPPFHRLFGRGSFSFAFKGAHFTLLDAASATIAPRTYDALAHWLDAGRDSLHLAMMHIPPLDFAGFRNGAFASRAEANKLLGLFRDAGVDLTVYGHVHTYKTYKNVGIEAVITGGGGAIPQRFDGVGRHFLAVDVVPNRSKFGVDVVHVSPAE